jgi:hypothetical protein
MADGKIDLESTSVAGGRLRPMVLDEPLGAWAACCGPNDVDAALRDCSRIARQGRLVLALWLPKQMAPEDAARALSQAGSVADTLVLVVSEEDRRRWGALGENDLRAVARGDGGVRVVIEPDPTLAVVGSMQWLRPGDTFCVVGPIEQGRLVLEALVALGAAWRAAWDEPESGQFHDRPRGPGGDSSLPEETRVVR